jgi:hypothetical protein
VVNSAAVTPGSGFGLVAAKAGFIVKRIEKLIADDKKRIRIFTAFPFLSLYGPEV